MYTYEYPRPSVTVDCIVFGWDTEEDKLKILLIERAHDPFKNTWAFPGGFVDMDEPLDVAAARELEEETGVKNVFMEQLYTFGDVDRDPRGRVISVAYFALVKPSSYQVVAASDAKRAEWFWINQLPKLAFDHQKIFQVAIQRLRGKIRYQPIGFELLSEKFTLPQLQKIYEAILGRSLDKRNFRKKILRMGFLEELQERQSNVPHRAAKLYKFNYEVYKLLTIKGFVFEI